MAEILILNNASFSYEQIVRREYDQKALTEFEAYTLEFCAEWLCGKKQFQLQTSGSTGEPKKIRISRKQMQISAALTIQKLGLNSGDKALVCIDTRFIGGKMMLVRAFEADMAMTIIAPSSNPLKGMPENAHFDFTALVPMQLQVMLENSGKEQAILDGMKAIIVGGGAMSRSLEEKIQKLKAPVYSTYGMTETVSHIALKKINGAEKSEHYKAFPGVKLGQDERGCLTISGAMTNGETIVTNDLVTLLGENQFQWEGRIDHVINSGGIKINTEKLEEEAEQAFLDHGINRRFIFAGLPDELLGQKLVLIIEGSPLTTDKENVLMNDFKKTFPAYHIPKQVYYLPKFIETSTSKIQRVQNLEQLKRVL